MQDGKHPSMKQEQKYSEISSNAHPTLQTAKLQPKGSNIRLSHSWRFMNGQIYCAAPVQKADSSPGVH